MNTLFKLHRRPHIVMVIFSFTRLPAAAAVNHQHGSVYDRRLLPYVTRYYARAPRGGITRIGVGQLLRSDHETACKWTAK